MLRATLSHHLQRSPEDLQNLLAWYKIRDTLLGENNVKRDLKKALMVAAVCKHSDAVSLTKLFAGRDASTRDEARQVFLCCENDQRAVLFAVLLVWSWNEIRRSAELGDLYAQASMAGQTGGEERCRWAQKSAAQGERDGFFWFGRCFEGGEGCERDVERAKENYLIAAELGYVDAMFKFGRLLDKNDPHRFAWLGKAAVNGNNAWVFLSEMEEEMRNFNDRTGLLFVVFAIWRALKGHIDNEKQTMFGINFSSFSSFIGPANQALQVYNFQLRSYRKAVDTWTLVGIHYQIVKDVRKMIAKMIWDTRKEAKYEVNRNEDHPFC
jgi:hypothetical protein